MTTSDPRLLPHVLYSSQGDAFVKSLADEGELEEDSIRYSMPGEWRWASGRKSETTATKLAST
jgi:hypothetical protein